LPRIDFYILTEYHPQGRELFACRLAEKAYRLGHKVYIQAVSAEQAGLLDDLLWTFRQGSFVPHCLYSPQNHELPPVLIGWGEFPELATLPFITSTTPIDSHPSAEKLTPLLINLSSQVLPGLERFVRVAEVVDQDPQILEKSRQQFRYYREHGYPVVSHKL
jgi:DNA polymerase-3 subunit chi